MPVRMMYHIKYHVCDVDTVCVNEFEIICFCVCICALRFLRSHGYCECYATNNECCVVNDECCLIQALPERGGLKGSFRSAGRSSALLRARAVSQWEVSTGTPATASLSTALGLPSLPMAALFSIVLREC